MQIRHHPPRQLRPRSRAVPGLDVRQVHRQGMLSVSEVYGEVYAIGTVVGGLLIFTTFLAERGW